MADLQQASPIPTNIPKGVVIEWTVDDVRNWLSQSMQLPQYLEQFEGIPLPTLLPLLCGWFGLDCCGVFQGHWLTLSVENEIAGDVLVHLDHEALKDLDVTSVGHRLYLLKQIYNLKIAHGVKFEKDDYVPICMDSLPSRTCCLEMC
jgi:SAM domain (Sterile alpha motif)